MNDSRTKNTKRNITWSYIDYIITLVFQFVSKSIIVKTLGSDYLGLSSLFTSILQVLCMADLGFSAAIVYNMYAPLAENDTDKVCALLAYYKRIYFYVGIVITIIGIAITPFIPKLIRGDYPESINIYVLYILYLCNTGVSYFLFAYKTALLNALQRLDLMKFAYCTVNLLQYTCQIASLVVFKNFYLFVTSIIVGTALKNLFAAYVAKKRFPQFICKGEIGGETREKILSKVKGLLISSISGVTYTTLDSIILSAVIGLETVAIYNNYLTIYHAVMNIILLVRTAMQASVGNSIASETVEKNYQDMIKWQFLYSMIGLWCSSCSLCLYQPFMSLWMGDKMLLSIIDVFVFSLLIFLNSIQHSFYLYLSGCGLWWEVRWAYIMSTICNLVLNIVLCQIIGTTGIILATFISSLLFGAIWQCMTVFKYYFGRSVKSYFLRQIIYFAATLISWGGSYLLCGFISGNDIISLVIKVCACTMISFLTIMLFFSKTNEYKSSMALFKKVFNR